jgi:3-hydroxyacyl-[acyl-carrier-protein] dehydratase
VNKLPTLPMDIEAISKCLPHRYPFLLIDRVVELEVPRRIVARKNISATDPHLVGHFPGQPVYPGVLVIESLAQAGGILAYYINNATSNGQVLLTEVNNVRFRQRAVPGDTLELKLELVKQRSPFLWFEGAAYVDGNLITKISLSALMR